jgi:hypothetical protein
MGKFNDLTGRKFGRLTVVKLSPTRAKDNRIMWECYCECTNTTYVKAKDLLNGNTSSCGCYAKEIRGQYNKKYNDFYFDENVGIGCYKDIEFYFDKEDYYKIKDYYWVVHNGYIATTKSQNGKTKRIYLHRLLFELSFGDKLVVDHINHDRLNNKKENLRIVTESQNSYNTKLSIVNKSGVIGVSYNKISNVWDARLQKDKELVLLDTYKNIEDAIIARLKAEKEFYGEFAPQKELFEKYNI